jgi:hypothetical protein
VPPLISLSLTLMGAVRDTADISVRGRWYFLVTLPCAMAGTFALLGGVIAFFLRKSD